MHDKAVSNAKVPGRKSDAVSNEARHSLGTIGRKEAPHNMEGSCNKVAPGSKGASGSDVLGSTGYDGNIQATDSKDVSLLYTTYTPGPKESVGHNGTTSNVDDSTCKKQLYSSTRTETGKVSLTSQVTSHTPSD